MEFGIKKHGWHNVKFKNITAEIRSRIEISRSPTPKEVNLRTKQTIYSYSNSRILASQSWNVEWVKLRQEKPFKIIRTKNGLGKIQITIQYGHNCQGFYRLKLNWLITIFLANPISLYCLTNVVLAGGSANKALANATHAAPSDIQKLTAYIYTILRFTNFLNIFSEHTQK